jgi:tRNA nucleotidyltransferase/poly(A) polymerase
LPAKDADLTSRATPEVIERVFEHTVPIGRPFGTMLIQIEGEALEHTTFRSDEGYSDRRRPDSVRFGESPQEDAARRDFTCNALYLDPLLDEFLDPTGGFADLETRTLRCVGDARQRFCEDGLRILRMARFSAGLVLEPAPGVLEAASSASRALDGVAGERVRDELEKIFARRRAARAIELLEECGALGKLFAPWEGAPLDAIQRAEATDEDPAQVCGLELGLALLLRRHPKALEQLRPSREEHENITGCWRLAPALGALAHGSRATRIHAARSPGFELALRCMRALGLFDAHIEAYAREIEALGPSGLRPAALLHSEDLAQAGIPRGPAWGQILREAETLQLDEVLPNREAALLWLAERARRTR